MNQKELFQHYVKDVKMLLNEGANPRELIEVLAAISVDVALHVAPSPEYAFLTVLEGLRDMASVHVKRIEDAESKSEEGEKESGTHDEVNEEFEMDNVIASNPTIH